MARRSGGDGAADPAGSNTSSPTPSKGKNAAKQAEQQQQQEQPQQQPGTGRFQGVAELAEMDDWGSAWQDAKEKGEGWGGRGKGGRGIQRNTWQPKDVYVEGRSGGGWVGKWAGQR